MRYFYDPVRKEHNKNPSGIVGRASQRPDCGPGKSVGMLGKSLPGLTFGFTVCRGQSLSSQWLAASLAQKLCKKCGKDLLGRHLAFSGLMGCCGFAHNVKPLECSGEVWAAWRALFFLIKKEPFALTETVEFKPHVSAETLNACALIGLHRLKHVKIRLAGTATLSRGCQSEGTSSSLQCEHNVERLALNVMEKDESGEQIFLFLDGELSKVALSCHIALDMCQEMHEGRWVAAKRPVTARNAFLSPWTGCDNERRGMW